MAFIYCSLFHLLPCCLQWTYIVFPGTIFFSSFFSFSLSSLRWSVNLWLKVSLFIPKESNKVIHESDILKENFKKNVPWFKKKIIICMERGRLRMKALTCWKQEVWTGIGFRTSLRIKIIACEMGNRRR